MPNNSGDTSSLVPAPSLCVLSLSPIFMRCPFSQGLVAKLLAKGLPGTFGRLGFPGEYGCLQSSRAHLSWHGQRLEGSAAAPVPRSPTSRLPSVGGTGVYSHPADADWRPKPHTGLTQDVGEGRAASSAAAGYGGHGQRAEKSLGLSLMPCVLREVTNTGGC